jgi:glutamine synthetase
VLRRQLDRARALGLEFYVGPELEYFYFKGDSSKPELIDEGGYFDVLPADLGNDLRKQTIRTLDRLDIPMEASHHEVAPSQHEIDPQYDQAMIMADRVMICRLIVKEVAAHNGVHATFMPKPMYGVNGSGMHVHQSLFRGADNAFFSGDDPNHLSELAKGFIAGQLKYMREICSLLNQYVNSFKRLVPGYEAPVYISWAHRNRTALIRVPLYVQGKESTVRAELRNPDPAANPYLAFAVMLAAGLDGIENEYELPPSVEPNIYKMTADERVAVGLDSLPNNLYEAVQATRESELVRRTLGDHIFDRFITNKLNEWYEYREQVTQWEIDKYYSVI